MHLILDEVSMKKKKEDENYFYILSYCTILYCNVNSAKMV